ncbi:MAG TPA: S41 family peptidase [Gemmatimonadaceae bacterium]|nr:S41 family peptidase [Gemmatimonadaceae bacterium]
MLAGLGAAPLRGQAGHHLDTAEVRRWREDLAVLRKEMPAHHANLFHDMTPAQFDSALNSISARLPSLPRHQVIVELQKLDALVGDGHSSVGPWRDSVIAFHTLPIALYWFPEGLMVRAADSAHANLLGGRVIAINGMPVDSVAARIRPLISRDNEMGVRAFTPFFMVMPEILNAIGVASDMRRIPFSLDFGGKQRTVVLSPAGMFPMLTGDADRSWNKRAGWVDARDKAPTPLWLSDPTNIYWFRYLSDARALYIQINTIQQKPSDSLSTFMAQAIAAADSAGADKLILDLRLNGGGNGDFNKKIMLPIIKSKYDTPGRFYVLTGRRTWSAAQMLVTELMKYTTAIFVGEPTASHGNHFGDSYRIVMPNSKVTVRVSTLWHQYLDSRDKRMMIEPQIEAPLSFADYVEGKDPGLEAVEGAMKTGVATEGRGPT